MKKKAAQDGFATLEDRILWETVAKTARPLKGKDKPVFSVEGTTPRLHPSATENPKPLLSATETKPVQAHRLHPIDRPTHKKIAKGRVIIEARIDLHGLSQGEAYGLLLGFLQRAHLRKLRHVLVITGKGSSMGSDGVLRQAVPHWFATPSFRILVNGYEDAARNHGGTGAIYVRMRRQPEAP